MDYEKAYKEALEKIRDGLQPLPDGAKISGVTRAFLEVIFPELRESEDEKIRKALVRFHKSTMVCDAKPKVLSNAMEKRKANHKTYKDYTLYYAAQRYGKPCEMFELKEEGK